MDPELISAILRIPRLQDLSAGELQPERLGGLTNRVYRIQIGHESLVVRIPGSGTEQYIDRAVEEHNSRGAQNAGVGAEILFFDNRDGLMLMRDLENCQTMSPNEFRYSDRAPARAGEALARMHNSGETFKFRFELFAMIDEYRRVLTELDTQLPLGYQEALERAQFIRQALESNPGYLAPCHNDPLCENFLDNGERMWIVDWEYSGMNDPFWDVGDFSVEAGLSPGQDEQLLRAYLKREPTAAERGRMVLYKAACDLLWTLWGLIQHAQDNPAEDFWAYATDRLERCQATMDHPSFAGHVAAVERA